MKLSTGTWDVDFLGPRDKIPIGNYGLNLMGELVGLAKIQY